MSVGSTAVGGDARWTEGWATDESSTESLVRMELCIVSGCVVAETQGGVGGDSVRSVGAETDPNGLSRDVDVDTDGDVVSCAPANFAVSGTVCLKMVDSDAVVETSDVATGLWAVGLPAGE